MTLAYLSTKRADMLSMLGNFHLLDGLPEGSTVTGAVLSDDANLLGTLCLVKKKIRSMINQP
jgi:hypothetical protein